MVLNRLSGRGGSRRRALRGRSEEGSQSVEFALVIPFVVLVVVLVAHAGVLGADLVAAQAVALQAARVASTADDDAVAAAVRRAAGRRPVQVRVEPPDTRRSAGDLVAATVRLRSSAFAPFGAKLWLPARVTVRTERP